MMAKKIKAEPPRGNNNNTTLPTSTPKNDLLTLRSQQDAIMEVDGGSAGAKPPEAKKQRLSDADEGRKG